MTAHVTRDLQRWDIGTGTGVDIVSMPLLEEYAERFENQLDGLDVLYINHAISDSLMVARALHRAGAAVTSVLIPYRGVAGPTEQAIRKAFAALGPTYCPTADHPSEFDHAMSEAVRSAICRIGASTRNGNGRWMIVEDGGYAFPMLHDRHDLSHFLSPCVGAVEHTTRGRWNYEFMEFDGVPITPRVVRRPAVTISGSALKTAHEGGFVAQALVDECQWLLRRDHQFLRHRSAAVVGYGRVGKALAAALANGGVDVSIVDPACTAPDVGRLQSLTESIRSGAFLIFGATGTPSFGRDALVTFLQESDATSIYLASASSKAVEFSEVIAELDRGSEDPEAATKLTGVPSLIVRCRNVEIGLRYEVRTADRVKEIVVLGCGYPVIFYPPDTHGAPNRAMDPVMTHLFLAAVGLATKKAPLPPRVYDIGDLRTIGATGQLPEAWLALTDEEALLRRWCVVNGVDWHVYRRTIGFAQPVTGGGR